MRLLQQFFEALEKLVEERDKKDGPELQLQLQSIYRAYFNHPSTFYYDQDAYDIRIAGTFTKSA